MFFKKEFMMSDILEQEVIKEIDEQDKEELDLMETETTLLDNQKELIYNKLGTLIVRFPTIKEESDFQKYYMRVYSKMLQDKELLTRRKMLKILEERGDWTEENEAHMDELQNLYFSKSVSIEEINLKQRKTAKDKEHLDELIKERQKIYTEFMELYLVKNIFLENTIEQRAEEETLKYKAVKLVTYKEGDPVWSSVEEMDNCNAVPEIKELLADCYTFWRGTSVPLSVNLPIRKNGKDDMKQV